jgi:transcriptional regulator with XRE-family HTH domain
MALGAILRAERERRGLTEHQVADATRIMVQMVREFEEEDFHRIAAPIYGRGFVKIYASYLELDPAPLVKEFDQLYAERGRKPPPPRVQLQRFGATPGSSLERVAPPSPPAGESEQASAPIRVPVPAAVRASQQPERPTSLLAERPAPPPPADLFGEPLPPAGHVSVPVEEEAAPPVPVPRPTAVVTPRRMPAAPELPEGLAASEPATPGAFTTTRKMPTATSVGKPVTQRSVLDSASHRFNGKPYRPSAGRIVGVWFGRFVSLIAGGIAAVVLGIGGAGRNLGNAVRKTGAAVGNGVAEGGRRLGMSAGRGAQTVGRLPWRRIALVGLPAVAALLVLWGLVAVVRSRGTQPDDAQILPPELESAAILERILPPPAGYAD